MPLLDFVLQTNIPLLLKRPLQVLYLLEVHQCCETVDDHKSDSDNGMQPLIEADTKDSANGDQPNLAATQDLLVDQDEQPLATQER